MKKILYLFICLFWFSVCHADLDSWMGQDIDNLNSIDGASVSGLESWAGQTIPSGGEATPSAQWRFEDSALTVDSIGSNTLTPFGTPVSSTNFMEGANSVLLNGSSQYFTITDTNLDSGYPLKNGDTNKKISVTFWIRPDNMDDSGRYLYAKYDSDTNNRSFAIQYLLSDVMTIKIGYNSGASEEVSTSSATLSTTGIWYHVGMTFDDSDGSYRIRIWDENAGALLSADVTGNFTNKIEINTEPIVIGNALVTGNRWIAGRIDNMKVYNTILTTDEIDADRNET